MDSRARPSNNSQSFRNPFASMQAMLLRSLWWSPPLLAPPRLAYVMVCPEKALGTKSSCELPTSSPGPSASPTNDPGAGCKILAHFSAWYHGKVAPGYHGIFPNIAVYGFLHSLCFSTVYAPLEAVCLKKDVRGVLASSCVLMVDAHGNSLGRFAISVNWFQGPCCSRIKRYPGWPLHCCLLFFFSYLLKTFRCPSSRLAVRSPDSVFLACLSIHKCWRNVHTSTTPHSMRSRYVAATTQRNRPITNNVLLSRSCQSQRAIAQSAPGSFVGLADGPGDEVGELPARSRTSRGRQQYCWSAAAALVKQDGGWRFSSVFVLRGLGCLLCQLWRIQVVENTCMCGILKRILLGVFPGPFQVRYVRHRTCSHIILFLLGQPSHRAPDENGRLLSTDEHATRSRTRRPRSIALP